MTISHQAGPLNFTIELEEPVLRDAIVCQRKTGVTNRV
jgi:hypothetical protein